MFGNMLAALSLLAAFVAVQARHNGCTEVNYGTTNEGYVQKCEDTSNPFLILGQTTREASFKLPLHDQRLGVLQLGAKVTVCDETGDKPKVQFHGVDQVRVFRSNPRFVIAPGVATVDVVTYCRVLGPSSSDSLKEEYPYD